MEDDQTHQDEARHEALLALRDWEQAGAMAYNNGLPQVPPLGLFPDEYKAWIGGWDCAADQHS